MKHLLLSASLLLCLSAGNLHAQRAVLKNPTTGALLEGFKSGSNTLEIDATGTLKFNSGFTLTGGSFLKSALALDAVENTALSTWAGTTNITTLGTITAGTWNGTAVAVANGGTGSTTAANARTALGLAIGTDVQAYNASLAAITAGTWTGAASITTLGTITTGTWNGGIIPVGNGGTAAASAGQARINLGLNIGSNVQAYSPTLAAIAGGSWTGAASITTIGTITTGTWNGTAVAVANGGTGSTTAANARTALGLGTLATQSGTFSGTSSGTNTGDQTITLTGDVTGSGTGSFATTLASTAVTPGSYTSTNITVDAKGRITAAASGSSGITIGTTTSNGTAGRVLYTDGSNVQAYTISGTGSVAMTSSPTFTTPALGTPSAIVLTNATGSPTGISLTKAQLNTVVSNDDPAYLGTAQNFSALQTFSANIAGPAATNFIFGSTAASSVLFRADKTWAAGDAFQIQFGDFAHYIQATYSSADVWFSYYGIKVTCNGGDVVEIGASGTLDVKLNQAAGFGWGTDTGGVKLYRGAYGVLHARTGTSAQSLWLSNTYTSSTSFENFVIDWHTTSNTCRVGTTKGSGGGTARAMILQTDGTTRITISATGQIFMVLPTSAGTTGSLWNDSGTVKVAP